MTVLSIDFETCSCADLRKTGAARYARDPSTRVVCMAWAFDKEPVQVWTPADPFPDRAVQHVKRGGVVTGWNVSFEFEVWNHVLVRPGHGAGAVVRLPALFPTQLSDTMARAAYWGLPMSLDKAAHALNCHNTKDKAGHQLMLRMCRPRRYAPGGAPVWWHETDQTKYDLLKSYCAQDVEVEREIASKLPPLPDAERAAWEADFNINQTGVRFDRALIEKLRAVADAEAKRLDKQMSTLTQRQVATTRASTLMPYLRGVGYPHDNLRKATMVDYLANAPDCHARDVVAIRAEAARSSTKKLKAMLNCMCEDDCARGLLQYYGAGRTGRWAGRLVQPQNFPRGTIKGVEHAIDLVEQGVDPETLDMLFEDTPLGVVASSLRGCIVPRPGNLLVSCDLSQIEARMVAWLAGQQDILDVFAQGDDVYVYTANKVGSTDRQLGKVLVLACGFGMGGPRFQSTARGYNLDLDDLFAREAVFNWREANPKIVDLWHRCDEAARKIAAGSAFEAVRDIEFRRRGRSMVVTLPSGRELTYRGVRLEPDDQGREGVVYDGVDQRTRQWGKIRTYGGKLVENFTQAAARDVMRDVLCSVETEVDELTPILSVHDELIGEAVAHAAPQALVGLQNLMSRTPSWAPGLPVAAAGWIGPRYKKG